MARYEVIAAELRRRIVDGELAMHEKLPPQRELAASFRTSIMTIRQALEVLRAECLLKVEHGLGTFVADVGRDHEMFHFEGYGAELQAIHVRSATEVLGRDEKFVYLPALASLGARAGASCAGLTRLRLVDGVPIVYQRSFVPTRLRHVIRAYQATDSLYHLLRERGGAIAASYVERVACRAVPFEVANILQVPPGAAALFATRTTCSPDGEAFLFDEAVMPTDRVELRVERSGRQYSVRYLPTAIEEPEASTAPMHA